MRYLALILLLTACGKKTPEHRVEPEFVPYVEFFYEEAAKAGHNLGRENIIVEFGELEGQIAICQKIIERDAFNDISMVQKSVIVDARRWAVLGDNQRTAVMVHELGHCLLDLGHVGGYCNIMNAQVSNCILTDEKLDKLLTEFFYGEEAI